MDEAAGAIATHRHAGGSNYTFSDGHASFKQFSQTFQPPHIDWHTP
jgi:prepilin-type processing-associated H-X9-DG protein